MDPSILKDVCAEVTCLHTSGLRKVAVVALGQTAIGGGVRVRPAEQGTVSSVVKSSAYSDDVFPSERSFNPDEVCSVNGKLGQTVVLLSSANFLGSLLSHRARVR